MWNSSAEFFAMGGYGLYVWSSFGVGLAVLVIEPLVIMARKKAVMFRLQQEELAARLDKESSQ